MEAKWFPKLVVKPEKSFRPTPNLEFNNMPEFNINFAKVMDGLDNVAPSSRDQEFSKLINWFSRKIVDTANHMDPKIWLFRFKLSNPLK